MRRLRLRPFIFFLLALILAGLAVVVAPARPSRAGEPVRVFVDGRPVQSDVAPVLKGGRVFLPFRAAFESLGAAVTWDSRLRAVTATHGPTRLELFIGSRQARLNGKVRELDVAPFIERGRTMIPLRFAAEALGAEVRWAPLTRSVWVWAETRPLSPGGQEFSTLLTGLRWIAYAPTHFNPEIGAFPLLEDIREDLKTLREAGFEGVVTYDSEDNLGKIPRLAKELGFKAVIAGVWLPTDVEGRLTSSAWEAIARALAARDQVVGYVVGHQGLGKRYSAALLAEVMDIMRASGRRVTTAEELSRYARGEVPGDWVFPVAHPWHYGVREPERAAAWVAEEYEKLKIKFPKKLVVIRETGFPSAGDPRAGEAAQATFFRELLKRNVPAVIFEAFDQPWKGAGVEPHWGLFDARRRPKAAVREIAAALGRDWDEKANPKPDMERASSGEVLPDNRSQAVPPAAEGEPAIEFVQVPAYGSFEDLKGRVRGVKPEDYRVAVYIYVASGWWTKPYWDQPLTVIRPDGTWTCDITTGGVDHQATKIAAYLVPAGYNPPLAAGDATLPRELEEKAVARVEVTRRP